MPGATVLFRRNMAVLKAIPHPGLRPTLSHGERVKAAGMGSLLPVGEGPGMRADERS